LNRQKEQGKTNYFKNKTITPMSDNTFTKSIQFWVDPNGIAQFAGLLEINDLPNCIMGVYEGAVIIEVDYNPKETEQQQYVHQLIKSDGVLHHDHLN
jgi:hypothetical protein